MLQKAIFVLFNFIYLLVPGIKYEPFLLTEPWIFAPHALPFSILAVVSRSVYVNRLLQQRPLPCSGFSRASVHSSSD